MTKTQQQIIEFAKNDFKDHVLTTESVSDRISLYKCARPNNSSTYAFRVILAPQCITVYGDIGDRMILFYGRENTLAWLRGAVKSSDYLISKMLFKKEEFDKDIAQSSWASAKQDYKDADYEDKLSLMTDEEYEYIVSADYPIQEWYNFFCGELNSDEPPSCEDWSADVYCTVECLRKFVELIDKEV